ncbi:MAG TPA: BON domain-containing protein [Thermoanaerobaculia bacterium]|nr:BON domain-containing protein [Thermoanaerobaculia bacterium]
MKARPILAGGLLALALAALPAHAADAKTSTADKEAALTKLLVEKLGKDAEPIHVTIVGEKTTLTGEVTLRATQELADEVLKYAGVGKIDNQVKAKNEKGLFEGKTKKEMADTKIEKAVRSKVKGEVGAHYKTIYVECTGSTCSVRGTLPDQARKDLALKAAAGVEGVKNVVDLVKIGPAPKKG